jgi:DMSO/TMAO reductase YedYZ molybdopterin-dependent catalytic subunit
MNYSSFFRCIEGWSKVVNWAGARFSDSSARFLPSPKNGTSPDINRPQDFLPYVSFLLANDRRTFGVSAVTTGIRDIDF